MTLCYASTLAPFVKEQADVWEVNTLGDASTQGTPPSKYTSTSNRPHAFLTLSSTLRTSRLHVHQIVSRRKKNGRHRTLLCGP